MRYRGELKRSDMLILASKSEPFGLTVAEALAAGVPVIATSEVGATEGALGLVGCRDPGRLPGGTRGRCGGHVGATALGRRAGSPCGAR